MTFRPLLTLACLPLVFAAACGGKSEEAPAYNADDDATAGDGDSGGDGDTAPVSGDGDGGDEPAPAANPQKVPSCTTFCEEVASCGDQTVTECVDSCTQNTTTSVAGQEVLSDCIDSTLCETENELAGIGALVCVVGGLAGADLTEAQSTYCEKSVPALNACTEGTPPDDALGTCEDTIGIVSDDALSAFNRCAELDCDNRQACLDVASVSLLFPILLAGGFDEENLSPSALGSLLTIAAVLGPLNQTEDIPIDLPTMGMGGAPGG